MARLSPKRIVSTLVGWLGHKRCSSVEDLLVALEVYGRTQSYDQFDRTYEKLAREPFIEQKTQEQLGEICENVYRADEGLGPSVSILVQAMRLVLEEASNSEAIPEEVQQLAEDCQQGDGFFDPEGVVQNLLLSERCANLRGKRKLVTTLAKGFLGSGRQGEAALDLYTFISYAGSAPSLRAPTSLACEATCTLANLLEDHDGGERIAQDIYRRALNVRPDPNVFLKLLESYFKKEMYDEVKHLIADAPESLLGVGAYEIGSLTHLEANDLYAHVVRNLYLKVLAQSEKDDLKERVARFLSPNLGILEEKLQKEVVEAIEKSLFDSEMPDQAKAERIFSRDSWEIMRHFATSPFLKLSLEHFAAKADLEDYRERAYKV